MESRITKIVGLDYGTTAVEENSLSATERRRARDAAQALVTPGFVWSNTAEGYDFWNSVRNRLKAIGNGEPLK